MITMTHGPLVTDVLGQDFQYFIKNLIQTTEESRKKSLTSIQEIFWSVFKKIQDTRTERVTTKSYKLRD